MTRANDDRPSTSSPEVDRHVDFKLSIHYEDHGHTSVLHIEAPLRGVGPDVPELNELVPELRCDHSLSLW